MLFGQITHRESLRNTITCLCAHQAKLYHLGFNQSVFRSTLADAAERRDHLIYADSAQILIAKARRLYLHDNDFSVEIDNPVYGLEEGDH